MEEEIWKDIPEYEGLYQASNLGNIRSLNYLHKKQTKLLKPWISKSDKYYHVYLWKERKKKGYTVQRLIALAFLNWEEYKYTERDIGFVFDIKDLCVNHKDENKLNNKVDNLEWCTYSYNLNYSDVHKNRGKKVVQYDLNGNFIKVFDTIANAAKYTNTDRTGIINCCKLKNKTANGYIWKYAEKS